MSFGRRQLSLSAPVGSDRSRMLQMPRLTPNADRRVLASHERRHATAKLRHEWLRSKQEALHTDLAASASSWPTTDMRKLIEFKKRLRCVQQSSKKRPGCKTMEPPPEMIGRWAGEITKRDIVDRPTFVFPITLKEPERRQKLFVHPHNKRAIFQGAPPAIATKQGNPRIHFIDREWSSEPVSWQHFNNHATEFQRRSWIA